MAYLVHNKSLLESVCEEIAPASTRFIDGEGNWNVCINESYTADTSRCPLLDAVISEVLRLGVSTALVRHVVAPINIRGVALQTGNTIMV